MAEKQQLNADGLQTYLGAVAASGIGVGLPVFWAIGYLVKESNSTTVKVTLDQLSEMTGYVRKELTLALKAIRTSGHRVTWTSQDACTITIEPEVGTELLRPFMTPTAPVEVDAKVDLRPPLDRLNELMGTKYQLTAKTAKQINARLTADKMTIDQLVYVVDVKYDHWKGDEKMERFLRPSTLFGTKAPEYAQELRRSQITDAKVISDEDLGRMFAG